MAKEVIEKQIPRDAIAPLDGENFEIKLLNIVKIQSKPFDPNTYNPEKPIVYVNEHGKEIVKKFNLLNVVRWRYADKNCTQTFENTEYIKHLREAIGYKERYPDRKIESNTRVVEWSDGTHSIIVGDEYFDMNFSKSNHSHVYLKSDDILVHKNKMNQKCIIKPSKISKRATKAILKHVNDRMKLTNPVEKTFTHIDDPKFKKGRIMPEKKPPVEKKRSKKEYSKFEDDY